MIARVLLTAALAAAAVLPSASARGQEEPRPGAERPAREEALRMVDAYVVSNLQESLGLTDEQFARAIPLVKTLQSERREYFFERARLLREMRRVLRRGGASEAEVTAVLDKVKALDADGPARTARNLAALDAMLTPLQQAKYRVLEAEVEQRLRDVMGRVRPRERQAPRPPRE